MLCMKIQTVIPEHPKKNGGENSSKLKYTFMICYFGILIANLSIFILIQDKSDKKNQENLNYNM